jgi:hypothetical protein
MVEPEAPPGSAITFAGPPATLGSIARAGGVRASYSATDQCMGNVARSN